MNLFKELWKQGRLAKKRSPMFEKNRTAKIWIYIGIAFWACYLLIFGVVFALNLSTGGRDAYQILNSGLLFILAIDFLSRFPFQQSPTQEVKPYLLFPIHKQKIIDFLLTRSGLDLYNLFWFFFFVPFAIFSIGRFFGVFGIISYLLCIWLLFLVNNYWFLLCKTLINEHVLWFLLPASIYAALGLGMFLPKESPIFTFFMNLGDWYIHFNILAVLGTIAVITLLWVVNRNVMSKLIYKEINKVDDLKIKHLSEYKFLDRYGMLGEFMRLEIRMLLRNKGPRTQTRLIMILVIVFAALMSFTHVYDGRYMQIFILLYAYCAVGFTMLANVMSYEGNYIDGLMVRKECILTLLKAKYYLASLYTIIPFIIIIPTIATGKVTLLFAISMWLFCSGAIYFLFFQLAVYNTHTLPLNMKIATRQQTSSVQKVVIFAVFLLPIGLFMALEAICGNTIGDIILLVIGAGFILTNGIWLRNIYQRFMKRRYKNMEELRDSRSEK